MRPRKTLEDVLDDGTARQAWVRLKSEIPERDLKSVAHHLEAIANSKRAFGRNPIPSRRQARRLAERLARPETGLAKTIARLNLYYGSELPLGDPEIRKLPETLLRYAKSLATAARTKGKSRMLKDFPEIEIEILRLLDRCR